MSTEDPSAETPREPAPPAPAPPERAAPPTPLAALPGGRTVWLVIAAIVVIAIGGFLVFQNRALFPGAQSADNYTVQPYAPETEIVAVRERVEARAAPDAASPIVVVFGQGATINVNGRVSRGLGGEWYAAAWNERTVFVRQQDAASGSGAPPTPDVREVQPEEEKEKPDPLEEDSEENDEEVFAEAPPSSPRGTLEMSDVNWVREPNARDFARYYPDDALDDGRSGRVVLDCVIGGGGRLDCSVANESPGGNGFGQAALNISRQVRVAPTLPDGSSAAGRHMRMPLAFRAG